MPKSRLLWFVIVLGGLLGAISAYVIWPLCASAFHGPFESSGYLILWPVAIVASLIPLFYFISAILLATRKKGGFAFLFTANATLLAVLGLFIVYMHLVIASSKGNFPEARILPLAYLAAACVFAFLVLSIWLLTRKSVRADLQVAR